MSISKQVTVWCDGCQEWVQASGGTVKQLRKELQRRGWRLTRDGRDFCEECVVGQRAKESAHHP